MSAVLKLQIKSQAQNLRAFVAERAKVDFLKGTGHTFVSTAQVAVLAAERAEARTGDPLPALASFFAVLGSVQDMQQRLNVKWQIVGQQHFIAALAARENWESGVADALATLQRDVPSQSGGVLSGWVVVDPAPAPTPFKPIGWDLAEQRAWDCARRLMALNGLPAPR